MVVFQWPWGTAARHRSPLGARHLGVGGGLVDEDDVRTDRGRVVPSNHASCAPRSPRCGAVRPRAPTFFARDLATLEEPPECADGDGDAALPHLPRSSASVMPLPAATRPKGFGMRLDPLRVAVIAALALGPNIALAPFPSPPLLDRVSSTR